MSKNYKSILSLLVIVGVLTALPANAQMPGKIVKAVASAVEKAAARTQITSQADLAKSVFRVLPTGGTSTHALSGFVFKTTYQGKEEIFGAIAAHAMPTEFLGGKILPQFTARVTVDNREIDIPASIVQVSSPYMLDMALVKFNPADEKLLTPLTLTADLPEIGASLQSIGFADEKLTFLKHINKQNTLTSLRVSLDNARTERAGMCGGPILTREGKVVGLITGDKFTAGNPAADIGFATKASYLRTLVDAYHGDIARASFPLKLGEHKIFDLNVDEHVSAIRLFDEHQNSVFDRVMIYKFPYNAVMAQLPQTRYIYLRIGRVFWNGRALLQTDPYEEYSVLYDWKEKKVIRHGWGNKFLPIFR